MLNDKLSFVIPCYRSEKTISQVIVKIIETVESKNPYEIICVNDCSPDGLYTVLKRLAEKNNNIKVINLAKNFGQHNAIMAGCHYVTGDIVICLDDDGQNNPSDCYKLVNALNDDVDIAFAKYPSKKESTFRLFGSWAVNKLNQLLFSNPDKIETNSYFACKRFIVEEIIRYDNAYPNLTRLIFRAAKRIINVNIPHYKREEGHSGYSFIKLFSVLIDNITTFSIKPLRIATWLGSIITFLSFLYLIYLLIKKMINPDILLGYSSMMSSIIFFGGVQLIVLGVMGEYIGRIYTCLNKAPQFVVQSTINIDEK